MFLEYLTNIYVLPLIATIIGLAILYLYDLFEKKQYTNSIYFRVGLLIYISCLGTIYISRLPILQSGGNNSSSNTGEFNFQSLMPQANEIKTNLENFNTGIPTF